jgi:iron complex transport system ATP-binding protein
VNLDVEGVSVTLSGTAVLEDVSATVDTGTLVGLVGPNGAGKTTLLRTITGAIDPDAGAVFVGDDSVHALSSRAASRRIASVPQQPSLDFEFTVREVVEMGRHPHRPRLGPSRAVSDPVDRALDRAQVTGLADRAVTTLSGGERQRVLLARALAQDAPVLVLDEPTASLDVHHQIRTLQLVRDLVDDGHTGIAAIHDLDLAARFCDRLVLLSDGVVHATGPPSAVLTPARIRTAFGASAVVTHNPVTGTPTVTVRDEGAVTAIDAAVHVFGSANHAAPYLPTLADAVSTLTLGPVVRGGHDHSLATSLDVPHTAVAPLQSPDADTRATVAEWLDRAAVAVVPQGLEHTPPGIDAASTPLVAPGPDTAPADLVAALATAIERNPELETLSAD